MAIPEAYEAVRYSKSLDVLTRVGFAGKGVVYCLIGSLAVLAAMQEGGETTDEGGAIRRIAEQPFGEVALSAIAVGLFAYAAWRLVTAVSDTEDKGGNLKGIVERVGQAASGLMHCAFAVVCLKLVVGVAEPKEDAAKAWTATLLQMPGGQFIVAIVALTVAGIGVQQIRRGWKEQFRGELRLHRMTDGEVRWAARAGKLGHIARGLVLGSIGIGMTVAAFYADPNQAQGLEAVFDTIATQSYGRLLLGVVAVGFICYGLYCMVEARYRIVRR